MAACTHCGAAASSVDRFCNECGHPRPGPPTADVRLAAPTPGSALSNAPPALLGVCALIAAMGVYLLVVSLSGFSAGWSLLTDGGDLWVLGVLFLSAILVAAALAVALLLVAWRMTTGDRVARGLAYVLLGVTAVVALAGQDFSLGPVAVLLGSLGCIAALALVPAVNDFFARQQSDQVVPVVVARTLLAWWAFIVILFGLSALPLAAFDGRAALVGGVSILIGIGAGVISRSLGERSRSARVVITLGAAAYVVLTLATGDGAARVIPIVFAAAIAGLLWVPRDARVYFGDISADSGAITSHQSVGVAPAAGPPPRDVQASGRPCPACRETSRPGDVYCGWCGQQMGSPVEPARGEISAPAPPERHVTRPPELLMILGDSHAPVTWPEAALLGRDPSIGRGDPPDSLLIRVTDPERMVSKTHAGIGLDKEGPWVMDRLSTNGTEVVSQGMAPRRLEPGVRARLAVGDVVLLGGGSQRLEVAAYEGDDR